MNIDREQDSAGRRWYFRVPDDAPHSGGSDTLADEVSDTARYMSVTTVLGELDEDTTGLEYWKDENDGVGDNADWEHLYWYSAIRGTLCHYQALKKFEHVYDGDGLWGSEESESMALAVNGPEEGTFEDASHDNEDVVYSLLKNQDVVTGRDEYEHLFADTTRLVDVLRDNVDYFVEAFETVCDLLGITDDSVIAVERFMLNSGMTCAEHDEPASDCGDCLDEYGYGGQCDLVYEDPNGEVVVVDLKTSSSLRQKHRLQAVAYSKSVERADDVPVDSVDRVEVIRIHPDSETWKVHSHEVPEHCTDVENYTDDHWYDDKWGGFEYDSLEDMWGTFKELAETAHENAIDD